MKKKSHGASCAPRACFCCRDCGVDTSALGEYYAVRDEVWLSVCKTRRGMLCLGCLSTRLGRPLVGSDFPDYPVNQGYFPRSDRFLEALARP